MFMRMIYDDKLAQATYLIGCQRTGEAIVIDPERDVDRYINLAQANGLRIVATAETHIHADFVSGSRELAEAIGAKVYVSDEGDADWKYQWLDKKLGGGAYEHQLLRDGDTFRIGAIDFQVMHTPGHTPEHIVFLVTDRGGGANEPIGMATGDFVFVGDLGRPDLLETAAGQVGAMEPSARRLFKTIHKIDGLPDFVQVWPAHGAGSACGKALGAVPMSTLGYERRFNPAINAATTEQAFVDFILSNQPEPPLYFANMKRVNKVGPNVLGDLPIPPKMTVAELRQLDGSKVAIIDTRPWQAFRTGHVPKSLSFILTKSFNTDAGSMVHEDEDIYLIIEPSRVEEAVRDLVRVGLDRIKGWYDASALEQYEDASHSLVDLPEVDVQEAERFIDEGARVLDVRRATEYAEGHLPDALNIAHTRLAARLDDVPHNARWVVHCRSGVRSARASAFLQRKGYQIVNLRGGYLAWASAMEGVER
ncbi:MAG: MBL fold metallo-hydrolase [Phycisphaerales bacterium]|nr:MBL fold metallo-hydrolase [Phycisphaerales bacterium]